MKDPIFKKSNFQFFTKTASSVSNSIEETFKVINIPTTFLLSILFQTV